MFAGGVGTHPSEATANIRLSWKSLPRTNTPAFYKNA